MPTIEQLPVTFRADLTVIECLVCHRRWRTPPDGLLTDGGLEYLVEHGIGHVMGRNRRRLSWKRGIC